MSSLVIDPLDTMPGVVRSLYSNMLVALNKAYPKWEGSWLISIDQRGGIVQVRNMLLTGKMGFIMKITKIDPEMRDVVRFAGELFERYRVARSKGVDVRESLANMNRAPSKEAIYDD